MSREEQNGAKSRIVTINSLPKFDTMDMTSYGGLEKKGPLSAAERLLLARHQRIIKRIERATRDVGSQGVLVTVQDRDVSRMQSELARRASEESRLSSGALEAKFGTGLKGGDWFGWLKSTLDWVDREDAHALMRPPRDSTPETLPESSRIALIADWGTGLYGAPEIARQIEKQAPFDVLLHLGDVYYSGTTEEVRTRMLDPWPHEAAKLSRALNANHEMYSGGYGYFDSVLPAFGQKSSYFALQNSSWLLLCLDTAYVDHDIDSEQIGWINRSISQAGKRKIVLFSHQQLFSRLDAQGPKLYEALGHLLDSKLITAWYWGHEHQCVLYDKHPEYKFAARCLGNGGIPEPRKDIVRSAPCEREIGSVKWRRLTNNAASPSCIALDGPNQFIEGEEEKFVPHGFMTLEFKGPSLTERVFLADGTQLFEHQLG